MEKRKNDAPFRIRTVKRKQKAKSKPNYVVVGIAILLLLLGAGLLTLSILRRTPTEPIDTSQLPTRLVIPTVTIPSIASHATLPPTWTLSPITPTSPLSDSQKATLVQLDREDKELPGKQVIITADNLALRVSPSLDQPIIEYVPRGAVKTILQQAIAEADLGNVWFYVADGYGWIPKQMDGVLTVEDYSPDLLHQMTEGMLDEMRNDRGNPRLWLQRGWMKYSDQNYGGAISDISVAIGLSKDQGKGNTPDYARLYDYRGKVYLDMGDNSNAIKNFTDAINYGLKDASVYDRRALAYLRSEMYPESHADFDEAIKLNPDYGLLYANKAALLDAIQPDDPAQLDLDAKAIETDMNFPYAYSNRARYYRHKGDFSDHVINDYTMALSFVPHDRDIRTNRAIAYSNRQEYQLALQDLELVVQDHPDYVDGFMNLGVLYVNIGDNQSAADNFLKAIKLGDPKGDSYYDLGVILHRDRQYEAAIYCYNKALQLNPDRQDAKINRSQLYEMLGGLDENKIMANPSVESLIHPIGS